MSVVADIPLFRIALGAGLGLLVALAANVLVLPRVLAYQRSHQDRFKSRVTGRPGDMDRVRRSTILVYRFVMPLVFAFVFGYAAYSLGANG
ncbi:hypothetical protein B7H23_13940 [Notoacmeibacter marinus]|uniref:Uncharacterized protein n=2 Tax=Notoacmeibacter marinus TaxID=1876515 RepID=A0A231UTL8_9HYPH|nr:hypothetical protein B7H23_13940 [Notoacmeibacter marinus]